MRTSLCLAATTRLPCGDTDPIYDIDKANIGCYSLARKCSYLRFLRVWHVPRWSCSAAQHQQSTADSPHLLSQTHTRTHVHLRERPDRYSHFRYVGAKLLLCVKIIWSLDLGEVLMPVYCVNYIKTKISIYKYQYINIYMFHASNVTTSAVSVNFTHKPVLEELSCDGAKEGFPLLDKKKGSAL